MALLFLSNQSRAKVWEPLFKRAGEAIIIGEDAVSDPAEVTHIMCWIPPQDMSIYTNLQVVICAGAGVDQMSAMPKGVALVRTLARGIEEMVRDWVVMSTLMLHRDMPRYLAQASRGQWQPQTVRQTRGAPVGIMGMGRIGKLVAHTLADLGFVVSGWSRLGGAVDGVNMFGADGLTEFLGGCETLICLLPLTAQTRGILNAELFSKLPTKSRLVHAGRGSHLEMAALKQALDTGVLESAALDVTNPEPLCEDHWSWRDPRVIITPHVAAQTDHEEGARHALAVINAGRNNRPLPGLVDQLQGY